MANRIDFDGSRLTSTRTLVDGQKLGHLGMVDGGLDIVLAATKTLKITSNRLEFQWASGSGFDSGVYDNTTTNMAIGQIYKAKIRIERPSNYSLAAVGFSATKLGTLVAPYVYIRDDGTGSIIGNSSGAIQSLGVGSVTNKDFTVYAVLDNTSRVLWYLEEATYYPTPTLVFINEIDVSNRYLYMVTGLSSTNDKAFASEFSGPDALQPALVTPLVEDTFTDTNGTAITSHTRDDAGAWTLWGTRLGGTPAASTALITIQSNKAELNVTGSGSSFGLVGFESEVTAYSDVCITANLTTNGGAVDGFDTGITARMSDNDYVVAVSGDCVSGSLNPDIGVRILEYTAGVSASRGSGGTIAGATEYATFMSVIGSSVTVVANGTTVTGTLSSATTNKRHGALMGAQWDATTNPKVDNLKVYQANGVTINV